jgi:peptidoglycan/LPS O-acetylase OafA/YrhL
VILLLGNYLEHNNFEIPFFYRTSGEGYMNFFTGVLAYTFYERVLKDRKKMSSIIIGGLFIFILLGTLLIGTDTFWGDKITTISLICILLLYLTANVYPVRKILEVKPALMFGEISMEIFLLHMPYLYIYLDVIKHTSLYMQGCVLDILDI